MPGPAEGKRGTLGFSYALGHPPASKPAPGPDPWQNPPATAPFLRGQWSAVNTSPKGCPKSQLQAFGLSEEHPTLQTPLSQLSGSCPRGVPGAIPV